MNAPWTKIEEHDYIDIAWRTWKSLFLEVLNKYAPVKTFRPRKHHIPWIDEEIRGMMGERDQMLRRHVKTRQEIVRLGMSSK